MSHNPYAHYVAGMDPVAALGESRDRIIALVGGWTPAQFERRYAPGKWTGRQLLVHLAQMELVFGDRARFALSVPDFTTTSFEQDDWIALDGHADAASALEAFRGLRAMNLTMFRSLTPAQRAASFRHPERGAVSVDWIITLLAGHDRHHLPHLESIR